MIVALLNAATGWQLGLSSPPAVARPPRVPAPLAVATSPAANAPAVPAAAPAAPSSAAPSAVPLAPAAATDEAQAALLEEAYEACRYITEQYAKTFYMGTKFFSPEKQRAVCAVYAWCRRTDDIVDKPRKDMSSLRTELADWRRRTQGIWEGKSYDMIDLALIDTVKNYPSLSIEPFEDMIKARRRRAPLPRRRRRSGRTPPPPRNSPDGRRPAAPRRPPPPLTALPQLRARRAW